MAAMPEIDTLSNPSALATPEKAGLLAGWDGAMMSSEGMVPDISTSDEANDTPEFEAEIDALVMATYGGPLLKKASRDNLKLPAPLNKTDSFDSLIHILKALPDTEGGGSPVKQQMMPRAIPSPPPAMMATRSPMPSRPPKRSHRSAAAAPAAGSPVRRSLMQSEAFAPLALSPSKLAAKVEALQKKLLNGGALGPAESGQLGSFSFKLNSAAAKQPLAEGQFSGVMPWKVEPQSGDHHDAPPTGISSPPPRLLPDTPQLVRQGSFTIKPKRRRVTTEVEDALELSTAAPGMDDPLVDTYLDICFFDNGKDDPPVLSIDQDEYADLIKAFEIDAADMAQMPDLLP